MDDFDGWGQEQRVARVDLRAAYCRKAAEQLLKRQGIDGPPVPVETLAQRLGFEVVRVRLPRGLDACIRIRDGQKVIEVASQHAQTRQRFSIAHELGHHCLGHAHDDGEMSEKQANIFAGALLVPPVWLKRDVRQLATVDELRQRYDVSREVMFIALQQAKLLGLVR